ncbi:GNAT family N-acetyltransferase [Rehaibacterium terrae]|jgi:RimJ/RimL family protein N-acetyltransferase|uniref:RimJ/RimL family protein N-acetyltransferase n=1 Tax=Rehaibacterium terrae TaxID=1341696 RepID=A0A7W7Y1D1_9GAMM|nr:GNAT family protein [Rehaibacterium terrae]MBB5016302.1 RimJ/RimL family protein N-acetyltransferase [Rehaibacterium terrae]
MSAWLQPLTLKGRHVSLEPLSPAHAPALALAAADGELHRLWYTSVPGPHEVEAYVQKALAQQDAGLALPFAVRDAQGDIVGSTRYCNADAANRRVEIGYTWYARRVQRTALNTEAKRLLLAHAFETLGCIAVEFRTHWHNRRSREAIARLGARQDGVLRNHMIMPDGTYRDTVVFSIIASEWPTVRRGLDWRLEQGGRGDA